MTQNLVNTKDMILKNLYENGRTHFRGFDIVLNKYDYVVYNPLGESVFCKRANWAGWYELCLFLNLN